MNLRSAIGGRPFLRFSVFGIALLAAYAPTRAAEEPPHSAELDAAIIRQAQRNGVPEKLVRRIVMRESKYNARARNHAFWGLMQISYPTAKSMGFKGTPQDLLNPFVNLTYAVPYLANAFIIAGKQEDAAVRLYASGYYETAKQRGLLSALRTADTQPVVGGAEAPVDMAMAAPAAAQGSGVFGALFGPSEQSQPAPAPVVQAAYNTPDIAPSPSAPTQAAPTQASTPADGGQSAPAATLSGNIEASSPPVTMTADKSGALHPPMKWLHDGGVSNIARGEQRIEQVAAFENADDAEKGSAHRKVAQTHSRKNTTFAAIDVPPANAQAYAAGGPDAALSQADSQTAIRQATGGSQSAAADPASADQAHPDQSLQGAAQPSGTEPQLAAQTTPAHEHAKTSHPIKSAHKAQPNGTSRVAKADGGAKPTSKHVKAKTTTETVASQRLDDGPLRPTAQ